MGLFFTIAVSILGLGFLWFYIARPILEDAGIIRDEETVNGSAGNAPVVMSRSDEGDRRLSPSSLETDSRQTADSAVRPALSRDVMLDTYRLLRKYGVPREEARPILKAAGVPLDNNLWSQAAPPAKEYDDDTIVTPWAGRRTRASYYDDPRLEYQQPPN
jgi:hypothetical protein